MTQPAAHSVNEYPITAFGAVPGGSVNSAIAIQAAVDAAHAAGGGRVVVPAGTRVRAGFFELKSGVELHVAEGAELLSATEIDAFPRRVFGSGEEADKRLWIGARHAYDITLSGTGTIDGQCREFALGETEHIFSPTLPWRPALTCFEDIERLTVRDLTFRDSANWTLHFTGCRDVLVQDVKIFNDLKFPNADGIDPDHCQRVRIARCHIVAADDCIVLKNTAQFTQYGACEDIEISECQLESVSSAFKIGSESHGDFRRVTMRDCLIERSNRGLAIQLRDGGSVRDVTFERITVGTRRFAPDFWGAAEPIYVTALPRNKSTRVGTVSNIRFRDISCHSENGIVIYGDPGDRIRGLRFEHVNLAINNPAEWEAGLLDLRPFQDGYEPRGGTPASAPTPWGHTVRVQPTAFHIQGSEDITLTDVNWTLPEDGGWRERGG
ncbi:MAG: glycoside hydrolase family 28 protein [Terrimicrobiaceae bacterium]